MEGDARLPLTVRLGGGHVAGVPLLSSNSCLTSLLSSVPCLSTSRLLQYWSLCHRNILLTNIPRLLRLLLFILHFVRLVIGLLRTSAESYCFLVLFFFCLAI